MATGAEDGVVIYGDGYGRCLRSHRAKNTRRVFVAGKYVGTERKLDIKGGNYPSWDEARKHSTAPYRTYPPYIPVTVRNREVARKVVERPGQAQFRKFLLKRDKRCPVSFCEEPVMLDAAHIRPAKLCKGIEEYNDLDNGIILRKDLHAAFDKGLFTIDDDGYLRARQGAGPDIRNWVHGVAFYETPLKLTPGQRRYLEGHRKWFFSLKPIRQRK